MQSTATGSQLTGRVSAILRAVGAAMPSGVTTSALARELGLTRPTAHRILSSLGDEGFVDHDETSRTWVLGPEIYLLGALAANRYDVTDIARDAIGELSNATGESAFFSARRGSETVCLLADEGTFPLRSHVLHEGIRFPLGVASAGLAILAFLPDEEIRRHLATADLETRFGPDHATAPLRRRLARTRGLGWAVNPGLLVEGSWGMGAAVFDALGRPQWAVSLTGVESRFRADRRPALGRMLLRQAHRIGSALSR
jgi:DNA-binding IclR family transcriptional regulator